MPSVQIFTSGVKICVLYGSTKITLKTSRPVLFGGLVLKALNAVSLFICDFHYEVLLKQKCSMLGSTIKSVLMSSVQFLNINGLSYLISMM